MALREASGRIVTGEVRRDETAVPVQSTPGAVLKVSVAGTFEDDGEAMIVLRHH